MKNKNLCIVPWTHTFLSPQCERRLCSVSREKAQYIKQYNDIQSDDNNSFSPLSLKDHWNSDYMKDIRKRMLKGERIEECEHCNNLATDSESYRDHFNNNLFPHLIDQLTHYTREDGHTSMKPRSFDYRVSNQCNFKCRMCGDLLSSSWTAESKIKGYQNEDGLLGLKERDIQQFHNFMENIAKPEFIRALSNNEVEEIYWVGGEPLLWDYHWTTMQMIIDSGFAKNIAVRYSSNLSIIEHKGINLFKDILPHFKSYNIFASIDAAGKVGEYIRSGLEWDLWVKNLKTALSYTPSDGDSGIELDITLTLPGLFGLVDLVKFSYEQNVSLNAKFVFAFEPSIVISPLALPRPLLNSLINCLIKQLFPYITSKNNRIISRLLELKKLKNFEEQYPGEYKEAFIEGRNKLLHLEKIREDKYTLSDIYSINKDIHAWWTQALG